MKLLTKEIEAKLPTIGSTEKIPLDEKVVQVKFFSPFSNWTWYAVEGQSEGDDFLFFGLVDGFEKEWGYFTLNELQSATAFGGVPAVERDRFFEPKTIAELKKGGVI